jgi:hypothetical protein
LDSHWIAKGIGQKNLETSYRPIFAANKAELQPPTATGTDVAQGRGGIRIFFNTNL